MPDAWKIEDLGEVELWTIDGEARRNAISRQLLSELAGHVRRVGKARTLRAVVVTGAGDKAFCAGADLKERATMSEDEVRRFLAELRATLRALETSPKVFIAAVNGVALGGGLELALACDLRVADPGARLGLPEVSLGIIPGGGGTQRLARAIGVARAKELILTAQPVGAAAARELGLVSDVGAPVRERAVALARTVAQNAPIALRQAKRAIDGGFDLPLEEGLAHELSMYEECLPTKDRKEALRAFAEKRKPSFTGE